MSGRVLTVLSICVALTLLVLGWRVFAPADLDGPPAGATPVTTAVSASRGANSPTATDTAATPARSEAKAPATPQRRARIVDETGASVADAEVAFDLSEDLREYRKLQPFDTEARLAAAPRHRTATNGIVALPTDAAVAFVIARAGDRFGHGVIEFDSRLFEIPELTIAPNRTLRIAVVGPRGEPRPNVPVEVTFQDEQALVDAGTTSVQLGRSDSNGIATLWHAQTLLFWNRVEPTLDLRAVVFGATTPIAHVRLADPVPDPIVLPCPDHGGIRVRAWIAAGIPNRTEASPEIADASHGERGEILFQSPAAGKSLVMPGASTAEWCLFPLALERQWLVGADWLQSVEVPGPTRQAEEVDLDLMPAYDSFTVLLLQPDGQPCACRPIKVDRRMAETDANGRLTFTRATSSVSFEAPQLHAIATVEIPASASDFGPTDLGTIRLQAMDLLAAGHVVDAVTGRPLKLLVGVRDSDSPYDGPWAWMHVDSSIDGAFEFWGKSRRSVQIRAETAGYARTQVEVAAGARDLVIAVQPARILRATVLVDPDVAIDGLYVEVRHGEHTSRCRVARTERGLLRRQFDLPDGDDLVLEVAGREGLPPVRRIPMRDWIPQDGALSATVDLRGVFANVLVTVLAPDDNTDGLLYVRQVGSTVPWACLGLAEHLALAVPKGTTLDAIVRSGVGMCTRTTLHPGENKIDVPPPSVAQIEVTGLPARVPRTAIRVRTWRLVRREPLLDELAAAGHASAGEVEHWPQTVANLEHLTDEAGNCEFDEGPVRFALNQRGSYVAVPYVFREPTWVPLLDAAIPIEVTTPGAVIEATLRLDPEKVRAALR